LVLIFSESLVGTAISVLRVFREGDRKAPQKMGRFNFEN